MKKFLVLASAAVLTLTGCESIKENPNTAKGAGIGAGVGAIVGGIVGHQTGKRNEGAAIGAILGGGVGGVIGKRMDNQAKELAAIAETKRTEQGLVSKLKSDILFETGKSDLKPAAKNNLAEMAGIMKKYPENVLTINGYTDSTGSEKLNEELSQKRAQAVKNELVNNGMPASTITTVGLGPANPVGSNATAAGRQQNRRVEIVVTVDESKAPKQ